MLCHLETEMGTLGVQEMLAHQPGSAKLKTATAPLCPARNPQMQFFSFSHISFFSLYFLHTPSKVSWHLRWCEVVCLFGVFSILTLFMQQKWWESDETVLMKSCMRVSEVLPISLNSCYSDFKSNCASLSSVQLEDALFIPRCPGAAPFKFLSGRVSYLVKIFLKYQRQQNFPEISSPAEFSWNIIASRIFLKYHHLFKTQVVNTHLYSPTYFFVACFSSLQLKQYLLIISNMISLFWKNIL